MSKGKTKISDLLDVIHFAIIKNKGKNTVILKELKKIDEKIQNGELENYDVDDVPFWKSILSMEQKNK